MLNVSRRRASAARVRAGAGPRLDLGRRRRARLHAVGRVAAARGARAGGGDGAGRPLQRPLRATRAGRGPAAARRTRARRARRRRGRARGPARRRRCGYGSRPSPAPCPRSCPRRCATSAARTPSSSSRCSSSRRSEAIERLRGGEADLAVVHHMPGVAVPETAGLTRRRLLVDHLYVVVPARPPARAPRHGERHGPRGRAAGPAAARHARRALPLAGRAPVRAGRVRAAGRLRARRPAGRAGVRRCRDRDRADARADAHRPSRPARRPPLAERPAGSRTVEALAPAAARRRSWTTSSSVWPRPRMHTP